MPRAAQAQLRLQRWEQLSPLFNTSTNRLDWRVSFTDFTYYGCNLRIFTFCTISQALIPAACLVIISIGVEWDCEFVCQYTIFETRLKWYLYLFTNLKTSSILNKKHSSFVLKGTSNLCNNSRYLDNNNNNNNTSCKWYWYGNKTTLRGISGVRVDRRGARREATSTRWLAHYYDNAGGADAIGRYPLS